MQNDSSSGEACHQTVLSLESVSFQYEQQRVIDGLNLRVLERDFVGIVGANGAGKSTLMRMIVGLLRPTEGEVKLFGQPLQQFRDWHRIGYVPQKNSFNPLFPATVREVVMSGLYGRNTLFRRIRPQQQAQCDDALYALGIEDLAKKRIGRLSGGQQQRVFLARALINSPDLLILDEPTVGIDAETQESFFHLLRHMHQHHQMTFLMVSHDLAMMQSYLGSKVESSGKLQFYIRHSHQHQCSEFNLSHSLRQWRAAATGSSS